MKGSDKLNKNSNFKVKKIDNIKIPENANVRVKLTGTIMEIMYSQKTLNTQIFIKKLNGHEYVDLRTGEVFEYDIIENRSENFDSVRRSLGRLRDYINTNVLSVNNCKWVTLTYDENMTDTT